MTCPVRLFRDPNDYKPGVYARCGQPTYRRGLCRRHYADRVRLGGAA